MAAKQPATEALLTTAADEVEAMMLEEILMADGIPVLLKNMGVKAYADVIERSVRIYVPASTLERARELITLSPPVDAADE